jgi:hypothetical protein
MFLMFARFSFKSSDVAAEDKNHLEHHVRLARQLRGVRMYLTGKLAETARGKPDHLFPRVRNANICIGPQDVLFPRPAGA